MSLTLRSRARRLFASRPTKAPCPRCAREVVVVWPHPAWRTAKWIWIVVAAAIAVITPIVAADAFFLTPLVLAFLMGGGAVMEYAEAPPRCQRCAYPLDTPQDAPLAAGNKKEDGHP